VTIPQKSAGDEKTGSFRLAEMEYVVDGKPEMGYGRGGEDVDQKLKTITGAARSARCHIIHLKTNHKMTD
jgi:hypothetical protein